MAASGLLHLHLWADHGYRHVPTIGPLFLLQGITGVALGIMVALTRRFVAVLAGIGFLAATVVGFVLSANVGLFGFRDSLGAPHARSALVIELAGVAVLSIAALLLAPSTTLLRRRQASRRSRSGRAGFTSAGDPRDVAGLLVLSGSAERSSPPGCGSGGDRCRREARPVEPEEPGGQLL